MIKTIKTEFLAGTALTEACEKSIEIAIKNNCNVQFDFNGVSILVTSDSNMDDLVESYFFMLKKQTF